jgi:hypothetical protein
MEAHAPKADVTVPLASSEPTVAPETLVLESVAKMVARAQMESALVQRDFYGQTAV